jgi:hypothetical protein
MIPTRTTGRITRWHGVVLKDQIAVDDISAISEWLNPAKKANSRAWRCSNGTAASARITERLF